MLHYAWVFLILAIIAAIFGFGGIAVAAEFLNAFPTLETVLIESWQESAGVDRAYEPSRPVANRIISCGKRNCRNGGFDIFHDISEMIDEKLSTKEFVKVCLGDEGSLKGRRLGGCINMLHYRLTLKYKP